MAYWPRYANNLQPWPIGHATRTTFNFKFSTFNLQPLTFNLGLLATLREQPSTLAYWPRYANNLQPWPIGHATRTTFNLTTALQNKIAVIYRIAAAGGKTKLGFDPCP
ncbi:MAG: hypothetical protein F6K50_05995 [Moorea sp. SIO3I7]|uniref:hypothetical protein n=1 Tax=Moorena sp. SIO3I8 TaxID=2607833 RepID=UPI0013C24E1C|nr:hypothetical protein [Moorena sp. SIO3I8]NEN95092.1 hypothetical protein [Moorena sp. SIO3I7]NEO10105.1 hypothetical protein [Moorena sp. SIO3I8]